MDSNKDTVRRYLEAFDRSDHEAILDCLTDDVEWVLPGRFHSHGKAEFDAQIENDDFVGSPEIDLRRLTAEGNVVVAEGHVCSERQDGGRFEADFCDVFELENGRIRRLTSFLMETGLEGTPG